MQKNANLVTKETFCHRHLPSCRVEAGWGYNIEISERIYSLTGSLSSIISISVSHEFISNRPTKIVDIRNIWL